MGKIVDTDEIMDIVKSLPLKIDNLEYVLPMLFKGVKPAEVISKDDMITILTDIQLYFRELTKNKYDMQILYEKAEEFEADFNCFINTKIYELSKGINNRG